MAKPIIIYVFAANDLPRVADEKGIITSIVENHDAFDSIIVGDVTVKMLADASKDAGKDLFMFHFGGHAGPNGIIVDDFVKINKKRLSRILLAPSARNPLQLVFLNGCESFGNVGLFMAKRVKAVIATNDGINDAKATDLAQYFYEAFFNEGYTLKDAFQYAEAIVVDDPHYPVIVNPGEIDENERLLGDWTLFIHSAHADVLGWKLSDFIEDHNKAIGGANREAVPSPNQNNGDDNDLMSLVLADRLKEALEILRDQVDTYDQMTIISLMGRLSRLEGDIRKGVISRSDADVSRNRIRAAVMEYVK